MRRCVLCGRWARLAFPRAREKKRKKAIGNLRVLLANNCCLPCPRAGTVRRPSMETTPGKHGEWRRRAGGASAACPARDPSEAWRRRPARDRQKPVARVAATICAWCGRLLAALLVDCPRTFDLARRVAGLVSLTAQAHEATRPIEVAWLVEAFARHRQRRCKLALRASSYRGRPSEPPRGWVAERFAREVGARGGGGCSARSERWV